MKSIFARSPLFTAFVSPSLCSMSAAQVHSFKPKEGYVLNEETAIKIALAVWDPIYGHAAIAKQAPYQAVLNNGAWVVMGTLPKNIVGGTAEIEISKENGAILRVSHGK